MPQHDVVRFVSDLSAKLATRSRHVCVFLGAGSSRACGLPDVSGLETMIADVLDETMKIHFVEQLQGRNLEQVLSRLRRIAALVEEKQQVDGLTGPEATALDLAICRAIVRNLDLEGTDLLPARHFAAWLARAAYHLPVEVFTVNYDVLLEVALEERGVPYFDGFVGSLGARFRTDLVEATPELTDRWMPSFFVRLWKLHGSVNWLWEGTDRAEIVRLGSAVSEGKAAAIYPSDVKYEESRRVPFVVLQDRFRRALNEPESLTIVSGYSFSDDHLNELIFEAAGRRERSEIIAFCYGELPEAAVERASSTPNLQLIGGRESVLSGIRDEWLVPDDPWPDFWKEDGFSLPDFRYLSAHLARTSGESTQSEVSEPLRSMRS